MPLFHEFHQFRPFQKFNSINSIGLIGSINSNKSITTSHFLLSLHYFPEAPSALSIQWYPPIQRNNPLSKSSISFTSSINCFSSISSISSIVSNKSVVTVQFQSFNCSSNTVKSVVTIPLNSRIPSVQLILSASSLPWFP